MNQERPADALRAQLRSDLVAAMKARQPATVAALRTTIAAIDNAEAIATSDRPALLASDHVAGGQAGVGSTEAERRELSVDEIRSIIGAQIDERIEEAGGYDALGQRTAADRLRREAEALAIYLPD